MEAQRIKLSAIWVSLLLTYLLGDVMRIFSGDFVAGELAGMQTTQGLYLIVAIILLIPIFMVFLTPTLKQPVNRWVNLIAAIFLFVFNLIGLPKYTSDTTNS